MLVYFFSFVSFLHTLLPDGWNSEELLTIVTYPVLIGFGELGLSVTGSRTSHNRLLSAVTMSAVMLFIYRYILKPRPLPVGQYGRLPKELWSRARSPQVEGEITPQGRFFRDSHGRAVLMRGVNLGGSSKLPASPPCARSTRDPKGLEVSTAEVSFVGRPFPLEEADEHLRRLSAWGLTLLRFVITWEALEHAGPGVYDDEYIAYVVAIARKAAEHGLVMIIDPHQDVWSRWSGGDGAPRWTLEVVGLRPDLLHTSGAAVVNQFYPHGSLPKMTWPTGYARLAAATMFTVFYAGDAYAPKLKVKGESAQNYLQRHFVAALCRLAEALREEPNVLGFGTGNEPSKGYVGFNDLRKPLFAAPLAWDMSAFQAMRIASGHSESVPFYSAMFVYGGSRVLNPDGVSAWECPERDVWRNEGVWGYDDKGQPALLKPHYFALNPRTGQPVDFLADFLGPLMQRVSEGIRSVSPRYTIFAEPHIDPLNPSHPLAPPMPEGQWAWAPHWYDAIVLMLKHFPPWLAIDEQTQGIALTPYGVQRTFNTNLGHVRDSAKTLTPQGAPVVVGETGIAFDLDGGRAYRTGDFTDQVRALDRTMRGIENALVNVTLWCYASDNANGKGDQWNGEDLSIWSDDQRRQQRATLEEDLHAGGRGLPSIVRPYPMRTAGDPGALSFDIDTRRMEYTFKVNGGCSAPTVFFVPEFQYPAGYKAVVLIGEGRLEKAPDQQALLYISQSTGIHTIEVKPA
eukprot:Hpha_TRINITY_DN6441_c0_g2::TRINITY_DN6441_c0_g2_i1::g.274::m.274